VVENQPITVLTIAEEGDVTHPTHVITVLYIINRMIQILLVVYMSVISLGR